MGVNKDMDLFETVRDKLGCEYISDMRSCRALLADAKKVVASLDLDNAWKPLTATPRMSDIPQQAPDRKRTPNPIFFSFFVTTWDMEI